MIDLLIQNARIIDPKNGDEVLSSVGIDEGIIVSIGTDENAKETLDAKGLVLSPGFIDIHIHEEELDEVKRQMTFFTTTKMLKEGVTTVVGGNCGSNRQSVQEWSAYINEHGAPVNYLSFVGHRYLREKVACTDIYRKATEEEIEKMAKIANEAIADGAIGISFGLEYSPGADEEEILSLLDKIDNRDILLAAHYRKDAKYGLDSVKELIRISEQTNLPMQISHIGSCTAYGTMSESLEIIDEARKRGVDIAVDCYPYAAFSTAIGSAVFDDGCFELWEKDYKDIVLLEEPYQDTACTKEIFEDARKNHPNMMAVAHVMEEDEVTLALQDPAVMVASDGMFRFEKGHPRGAGTYPRILGKYVREMKALPLYEALYKSTLMPAKRIGLAKKGRIEEGCDADLVLFDPDTILDKATFQNSILPPEGIHYVFVAGKIAVKDNEIVQDNLGVFIKGPLSREKV